MKDSAVVGGDGETKKHFAALRCLVCRASSTVSAVFPRVIFMLIEQQTLFFSKIHLFRTRKHSLRFEVSIARGNLLSLRISISLLFAITKLKHRFGYLLDEKSTQLFEGDEPVQSCSSAADGNGMEAFGKPVTSRSFLFAPKQGHR